jgi:hypothetical protein
MSLSRRSRVLIPGDQELSLVQLLLHILQPPLDRVPDDPVQHVPDYAELPASAGLNEHPLLPQIGLFLA